MAAEAREVGVSPRTARRRLATADALEPHPDLAEKVDSGEMEAKRALRVVRERAAEQRRSEPAAPPPAVVDGRDIRVDDLRTALADQDHTIDAIVTDNCESCDGPPKRRRVDALPDLRG